jgi:hypothetical protein
MEFSESLVYNDSLETVMHEMKLHFSLGNVLLSTGIGRDVTTLLLLSLSLNQPDGMHAGNHSHNSATHNQ